MTSVVFAASVADARFAAEATKQSVVHEQNLFEGEKIHRSRSYAARAAKSGPYLRNVRAHAISNGTLRSFGVAGLWDVVGRAAGKSFNGETRNTAAMRRARRSPSGTNPRSIFDSVEASMSTSRASLYCVSPLSCRYRLVGVICTHGSST